MCGFCGYLQLKPAPLPEEIIISMSDRLYHRGPDDQGHWQDKTAGIALGHRRLSIIDLTAEGHQPMHSASGRYVLAYNGEIYNFKVIKTELEGSGQAPVWRGHSDTEVLLAAIDAWGINEALKKVSGCSPLRYGTGRKIH